jgi:hypothetical protein
MPLVPFAQFGPDRSPFDAQFCDKVENVLPIQNGWGPFPAFVRMPNSLPLPGTPMGSDLIYVSNGAYRLFAGTKTDLYMFDITTLGWLKKTRASGPYNSADGVRWSTCQYGDDFIVTNGQDQPQWIDSVAADQFADVPNAPKAYNVAAVGDFVMFSHLQSNQRMVQWSGLNSPFFYTPRQQSSDFQAFPDGGEIMGTASGPDGIVIFAAESIREGTLALDTPLVFNFKSAVQNHGCLAPKSIVQTGQGIFYLSDDGFYKYSKPPTPIGITRIDRWFHDNIQNDDIYSVYGGEDPVRKIVYWAFHSKDNQVAGTYDRVLLYHYGIDQWSVLDPGLLLTGLISATSPGYTLDGLSNLGIGLDSLGISLDSRAWSGSTPVVAAFDNQNYLGFFAGDPMQAILQTGDNQFVDGMRASIFGWRPLTDAPSLIGRTATKETPGDNLRWRDPSANNRVGVIPQQTSGMFHRFELTIPATSVNNSWTAVHGIYPVDGQPDGEQ